MRRHPLVAALLGAIAFAVPAMQFPLPRETWGAPPPQRASRRGPGWTHAQVQRMASKRRNQQRNKRAHRG